MPHVSSVSGAGDDLGSTDEVKVFKDEGEEQDEKRSSENLTEDKTSLIDLTESQVRRLFLLQLLLWHGLAKSTLRLGHHASDRGLSTGSASRLTRRGVEVGVKSV